MNGKEKSATTVRIKKIMPHESSITLSAWLTASGFIAAYIICLATVVHDPVIFLFALIIGYASYLIFIFIFTLYNLICKKLPGICLIIE